MNEVPFSGEVGNCLSSEKRSFGHQSGKVNQSIHLDFRQGSTRSLPCCPTAPVFQTQHPPCQKVLTQTPKPSGLTIENGPSNQPMSPVTQPIHATPPPPFTATPNSYQLVLVLPDPLICAVPSGPSVLPATRWSGRNRSLGTPTQTSGS